MMRNKRIPPGVMRAVAGILEAVETEPYGTIISEATEVIGPDVQSEKVRARLIIAVRLNIVNRREWPFDRLQRRYSLPCSHSFFKTQKYRYISEIARRCGML